VAARVALVAQHENAFQHYAAGISTALMDDQPPAVQEHDINFEFDYRLLKGVMTMNTLTEGYTTTARNPHVQHAFRHQWRPDVHPGERPPV